MFNPEPRVRGVPIDERHACWVIDDALRKPESLVAYADAYREDFAPAPPDAFPGRVLRLPEEFSALLEEVFRQHVRQAMGARRTLYLHSRLSMATLPPDALPPSQWICRRERAFDPQQCVVVAELFLFHDIDLGGIHFFRPRQSSRQIDQVVHDAGTLAPDEFTLRHGIRPGYPSHSNDYFEHLLEMPPAWNRLVLHAGEVFHAAAIPHPRKLSADPRHGRLTLTARFTCRRNLVAW